MQMYALVLKAGTIKDAFSQALKIVGVDPGLLTGGNQASFGDWLAYTKEDATGLSYGLSGHIVGENAYVVMVRDDEPGVGTQNATMATMTWYDQDELALERHVRFLENVELNRTAGQFYEYSNANYGVLGAIVQTVSDQSFEEYLQQFIFEPLDMQNSFVSQDEAMQNGMAVDIAGGLGFQSRSPSLITAVICRMDS